MKQFRVDTDATIEAVLPTGQKLQFGQRVAVTVQRPNRMRVERVGELINQTFYYDGKTLSVNLPDEKYYATAQAPPTMEAMLDFARDKLDVIAPGSDLIYKNAFERLTQGLTSAFVVGKAVIGGVRCDHIAFRNAEVDWQIWIQEGDKPLPRKFIVTSKRMPRIAAVRRGDVEVGCRAQDHRCHIQVRAAEGLATDRVPTTAAATAAKK